MKRSFLGIVCSVFLIVPCTIWAEGETEIPDSLDFLQTMREALENKRIFLGDLKNCIRQRLELFDDEDRTSLVKNFLAEDFLDKKTAKLRLDIIILRLKRKNGLTPAIPIASDSHVSGSSPEKTFYQSGKEPIKNPKKNVLNHLGVVPLASVLAIMYVVLRTFEHLTLRPEVVRNEEAVKDVFTRIANFKKRLISKNRLMQEFDIDSDQLTLMTNLEKQVIRKQLREQPFEAISSLELILLSLSNRAKIKRATHTAMQCLQSGFYQDYASFKNWLTSKVGV